MSPMQIQAFSAEAKHEIGSLSQFNELGYSRFG